MTGKLAGKKVAMIVANEFEDIELLYPILRLSKEGAEIVVVPVQMGFHPRPYLEGKPVTGRFGHPVPVPVMPPGRNFWIFRQCETATSSPAGHRMTSPSFARRSSRPWPSERTALGSYETEINTTGGA